MNPHINIEEIRSTLLHEIAKTVESIEEYKELSKPVAPDNAIGRVTRMDAINNKSVTEFALRNAEHRLSKLQHVLATIDEPGFGLCRKCRNPIPLGRILIMPESMYCVRCAR
jgi:DnaK suppressor protein